MINKWQFRIPQFHNFGTCQYHSAIRISLPPNPSDCLEVLARQANYELIEL
jgi:hypothetical protein